MTRSKITLGLTWTCYVNLYGMMDKLYDALKGRGWTPDKINEYTATHLHNVNEESRKANEANGGPDLPK